MRTNSEIISFARTLGISCCGFAAWEGRSAFVCLFPYYTGELPPFPMARYARIPDYHRVAKGYLQKIADFIGDDCRIFVDSGQLPERRLAVLAGLGWIGKNACLINPIYGSYVFIGVLLLNRKAAWQTATDAMAGSVGGGSEQGAADRLATTGIPNGCGDCRACVRACPGRALSPMDFSRCISHLTQKKELSGEEEEMVRRAGSVWGCDVCQAVCPKNTGIPKTPIREFYGLTLTSLEGIEALSNRGFLKKYREYPFTWRGRGPLVRNSKLTGLYFPGNKEDGGKQK